MVSNLPSWEYADKLELKTEEFVDIFNSTNVDKSECLYVVLDVRNDDEIEIADIPKKNEKGIEIEKINIPVTAILDKEDILEKIPRGKYILCLCRSGNRSGKASIYLQSKGYSASNIIGGMIALSNISNFKIYSRQ